MTDEPKPLTEEELAEFERVAARFLEEFRTATAIGGQGAGIESSFAVITQRLVAEVRRLRSDAPQIRVVLDSEEEDLDRPELEAAIRDGHLSRHHSEYCEGDAEHDGLINALALEVRRLRAGAATSSEWLTSATSRLVPELNRLRDLIKRAVGRPYVEGETGGYLGEPLDDGQCVWCQASIRGLDPEPHASTCPWSELVAEAERE